jgi:hypothetical protein
MLVRFDIMQLKLYKNPKLIQQPLPIKTSVDFYTNDYTNDFSAEFNCRIGIQLTESAGSLINRFATRSPFNVVAGSLHFGTGPRCAPREKT